MSSILLTAVICYAIYRASKFFLVSWQNEVGYIFLIACLSLAWFYGSFSLWVNLAIGGVSFVALYLLLSRMSRLYIRKPIVTHLSMIAIVYGFMWIRNANDVQEFLSRLM